MSDIPDPFEWVRTRDLDGHLAELERLRKFHDSGEYPAAHHYALEYIKAVELLTSTVLPTPLWVLKASRQLVEHAYHVGVNRKRGAAVTAANADLDNRHLQGKIDEIRSKYPRLSLTAALLQIHRGDPQYHRQAGESVNEHRDRLRRAVENALKRLKRFRKKHGPR